MIKQFAPRSLAALRDAAMPKMATVLGLFATAILLFTASSASAASPRIGTSYPNVHPQHTVSNYQSASIDILFTAVSSEVISGHPAHFDMVVTNNGSIDLFGVTVSNSAVTNCDRTIGDLTAGAAFSDSCSSGDLSSDLSNEATARGGYGSTAVLYVEASQTDHVTVVHPSISIDKTPSSLYVTTGDSVTFDMTIENDGDVPLSHVSVSNSPTSSCSKTIGILPAGGTHVYSCAASNITADFTDTASVSGQYASETVSDTDSKEIDVVSPQILVQTTALTPIVASGDTAEFEISVENTGDVDLTNISIVDVMAPDCDKNYGRLSVSNSKTHTCTKDNITADIINSATATAVSDPGSFNVSDTDTVSVDVRTPSTQISKTAIDTVVRVGQSAEIEISVQNDGDAPLSNVSVDDADIADCDKTIGALAVGQSFTYSCFTGNLTAPLNNSIATAFAQYGPSSSYMVSDTDSASVGVVNPDITIEKTAANSVVLKNSPVDFTIRVTNSGDVALTNVQVTDLETPDCDRNFALLAVGAEETYTCQASSVSANFVNEAEVSGSYISDTVTDSDSVSITVIDPGISIELTANTPTVVIGDDAEFTIRIENTGDTPLTSVSISDDLVPDCNKSYGSLAVGVEKSHSCTASNITADFTNSATVTANTSSGGFTVDDTDSVSIDAIDPSIKVIKFAVLSPIPEGGTGQFRIKVENTGDVALFDVVITDPLVPACNKTYSTLTAGQIKTHLCEESGITSSFTNTANVTAKDSLNNTYSGTDNALMVVNQPDIQVTVQANPSSIDIGDTATFDISVRNIGNTKLFDVEVTAPGASACNNSGLGSLNQNQTKSYSCSVSGLTNDFTIVVVASAVDSLGTGTEDTDSDTVTVVNPKVSMEVAPVEQSVDQGSNANFTVTVFNTGNVPLRNVEVTSDTVPNCTRNLPNIQVNDSNTFTCSAVSVQEDFVNNLTVTTQSFGISASDSAVAVVDVENTRSVVVALSPTLQTVSKGGTATFEVTVFNNSTVTINNIVVSSSAPGDDCSFTFSALPAGFSKEFEDCHLQNVQSSLVNTFTVTAVPQGSSEPITDTDVAIVNVVAIGLTITPDKKSFEYPGGMVRFTAVFDNNGSTDLELGALEGVLKYGPNNRTAPLLNNDCEEGYVLTPGSQYTCSFQVNVSGSSGSYSVEIEASATDTESGITVSASDVSEISVSAPPITDLYLPILFADYRPPDEPNNTCSEAFPLATNVAYAFYPNDTTDIYTFNLSSASNLNINVTNFTPVKGQIALFYGNCSSSTFIANDGKDSTTKTLNLAGQPAGEYILLVITDGTFSTTQPYNLTISTP